VQPRLRRGRSYETELTPRASASPPVRRITRAPNALLEPVLGVGDAWSFVSEADRQWEAGNRGWAVEFEEGPPDG
jgi:hypothetical protein